MPLLMTEPDPKARARELIAKYGRDRARELLSASASTDYDRAVLSSIDSAPDGPGFLRKATDVPVQQVAGVLDAVGSHVGGLAGLSRTIGPPGVRNVAGALERLVAKGREALPDPVTPAGQASRIGSRIVGEGAAYMVPYSAATKGLKVVRGVRDAARLSRFLRGTAAGAAVDVTVPKEEGLASFLSAPRAEGGAGVESLEGVAQSEIGSRAFDVGFGGLFNAGFEALSAGRRAIPVATRITALERAASRAKIPGVKKMLEDELAATRASLPGAAPAGEPAQSGLEMAWTPGQTAGDFARAERARELAEQAGPARLPRFDLAVPAHLADKVASLESALGRARIPGVRQVLEDDLRATRAALSAETAASIDPDQYVNVAKFNLDTAGEARLRQSVRQVVAEEGLSPKQVISHKETIAEALGVDPVGVKAGAYDRTTLLSARNFVKTTYEESDKLAARLADADLPLQERADIVTFLDRADRDANAVLGEFTVARSEAGRTLNSLKIQAQHSADPFSWYLRAAKHLDGRPLTDTMRRNIEGLITKGDRAGLAEYVAGLRAPSGGEQVATVFKAGLLSIPGTHEVNITGNTTMGLLETVKDAPAFAFSRLFQAFSGLETNAPSMRGVAATFTANTRGQRRLLNDVLGAATNPDTRRVTFTGNNPLPKGVNAFLDAYTGAIFGALNKEDQPFRRAALARYLEEQARIGARADLRAGAITKAELGERVIKYRQAPTDEMVAAAIGHAEVATFRNKNIVSRTVAAGKQVAGPISDFPIPFNQTPSNVGLRLLEYSPIGLAEGIAEVALRGVAGKWSAGAQRALADRLGRSVVGTLPLVIGWQLAEHGLVTGAYPTDPSEQDQWQREGKTAFSILINGQWRSLGRVAPLGALITTGAAMRGYFNDPERTWYQASLASAGAMGKAFTETPFVTGIKTTIDAFSQPEEKLEKAVEGYAGAAVPGIVRATAQGIDPVERDVQNPLERIRANLPGLSQGLEPKIDTGGNTVTRDQGVLGRMFDITNARTDQRRGNPLLAELSRLGVNIELRPRDKKLGETREDYTRRLRAEGPPREAFMQRIVASAAYQALPDTVPEEYPSTVLSKERVLEAWVKRIKTAQTWARRTELRAAQ